MNAEVWVVRLAPDGRGWRTVEDLAVELDLAGEDDPFDPQVWANGATSMRLAAETVFDAEGATLVVEFRWPDDEPPPAEWSWELTPWLTVLDRPARRRAA